MTINIWSSVGGVTTALPIETLLGTANQLLGMNPGATAAQWKSITFDNVAGQLANVAGAVGAPSWTFQGDLTSGWYRPAANQWALAISGVQAILARADAIIFNKTIALNNVLLCEDQSGSIVAAATTDLDAATGNYITVTHAGGVVAITSFDGPTISAGTCIEIKFSIAGGTLTLTHNAVSMILLGGANIILQNGDITRWRKINDASAFWEMVGFQRGSNASVLTTKGDLLVGLGAGITDRMAAPADGNFFVADSTQITGWRSQTVTGSLVPQCVNKAVTDSVGTNAAITTGAGLRPGLSALTVAMLLAFGDSGAIESLNANNADILGADLPINNTSYIYRNRGVTWISGLVPPQKDYFFDRTKQALLNFEAPDGSTSFLDDFGNSWVGSGQAQIDTAQFKFGTASLLLDGTGDYITSSNFTSFPDGSWEVAGWGRTTSVAIAIQTFFNAYNAGTWGIHVYINAAGKVVLSASSNGTSYDIVNASAGATTLVINTWYRIRVVFDALAGTLRVYLSNNGAAETQEITVSTTSRICAITTFRIGSDSTGAGNSWNGWIDAFRFLPCATATATQTPAAVAPTISDHLVNFYHISRGVAYEATGASTGGGIDPTFTARERLDVAECDTSAVAITAVRNYAIKGKYKSIPQAIAADTRYPLNANMGTTLLATKVRLRSPNFPNSAFNIFDGLAYVSGASFFMCNPVMTGVRGNILTLISGDSGIVFIDSSGAAASIQGVLGSTAWIEVERSW